MTRLFVALKIPGKVRNEIINLRNKAVIDYENYKWEPEEKIHLTLKFIGEVKDELTAPISDALNFVENYKSFNCSLTKFDFFYRDKRPKILWLGLDISNEINNLVHKINEEMAKFSIPAEKRAFNAHLTIKRLKGNEGNEFVKKFKEFKIPELNFIANEIMLVKSELLPSGSRYTEIKNFKLK